MNNISPLLNKTMQRLQEAQANKKETYTLKHDGQVVATGTEGEILAYVHKHSNFSLDWACKHEGYELINNQ
jgi:uncharacterized protein YkuJ